MRTLGICYSAGVGGRSNEPEIIPARSFGNCRWCAAESVRLQFLMCADCFLVAETVPSKTNVLLNRPDVKKRLKGGVTLRKVLPELRSFLLDEKSRFPTERRSIEHWAAMQEQTISLVTDSDISRRILELKEAGEKDLPTADELATMIGLDTMLRFVLHVAILRGVMKLDTSDEEGMCLVCGRTTEAGSRALCPACRTDLIREVPDSAPMLVEEPKANVGMNTRDLIMGKRRGY